MAHDFWILVHGEREAEFRRVLGTNRVPVRSPLPIRAKLGEEGFIEPCFFLAQDVLTDAQRLAVARHVAERFHAPLDETLAYLHRPGLPIRAAECSVIVHNPRRRHG